MGEHPLHSSVTVYGAYGSFCTQKVYLTLAEKGVDATRRIVDIGPAMENYEPWYARINPRMVVPTLDDDGTIVCDSSAIIRYIDENFEGPALMPEDGGLRREAETWIERIDALPIRELSYGGMRGALAVLRDRVIMPRRVRMLRKHQREAPGLHDVYEARLEDVARWMATIHQPAELAAHRKALDDVLDELDVTLRQGEFVVGDRYSLADMMATVLTARIKMLSHLTTLEARPSLLDHYARMRARSGFPAEDIVESLDKKKILRTVAPFVLPRVAAAFVVCVGVALVIAWAI